MSRLAGSLCYHLEAEWFKTQVDLVVHQWARMNCEEFHLLGHPLRKMCIWPDLTNTEELGKPPGWGTIYTSGQRGSPVRLLCDARSRIGPMWEAKRAIMLENMTSSF